LLKITFKTKSPANFLQGFLFLQESLKLFLTMGPVSLDFSITHPLHRPTHTDKTTREYIPEAN
jgi:hypothetical protein